MCEEKYHTPPHANFHSNSTGAPPTSHTRKGVALYIKPTLGYPSRWLACTIYGKTSVEQKQKESTKRKHTTGRGASHSGSEVAQFFLSGFTLKLLKMEEVVIPLCAVWSDVPV